MRKYEFDYSADTDTLTVIFQPHEENGEAELGPYYTAVIYRKDGVVTMYKVSGIRDILEAGGSLNFMEDVDVDGEIMPAIAKELENYEKTRPKRTDEEEEAYQIALSQRKRKMYDILQGGIESGELTEDSTDQEYLDLLLKNMKKED
ncbi:MAG: hypothetical protein ACOYJJ_07260 [Anaerovoracaceae bacterium]